MLISMCLGIVNLETDKTIWPFAERLEVNDEQVRIIEVFEFDEQPGGESRYRVRTGPQPNEFRCLPAAVVDRQISEENQYYFDRVRGVSLWRELDGAIGSMQIRCENKIQSIEIPISVRNCQCLPSLPNHS
jgi:hypothetical protein